MVYVIAAYSITVGVLALYGVLLQHRSRVAAAELARARAASAPDPRRGFNLGACLTAPVWMLAHGLRAPGAFVLLLCAALPLLYRAEQWVALVFLAAIPLAAGVALGFTGNRIAVAHRGLARSDEISTSQLPWAVAGVVVHTFVLPWIAYALAPGAITA